MSGLKPGQEKSSPAKLFTDTGGNGEDDEHWNDVIQRLKPAPIHGRSAEQVEQVQGSHRRDDREEQREGPPLDANPPDQEASEQFPKTALATFNNDEHDRRQTGAKRSKLRSRRRQQTRSHGKHGNQAKDQARTSRDIAGYFFTNADIFYPLYLEISWREDHLLPASLDTVDH